MEGRLQAEMKVPSRPAPPRPGNQSIRQVQRSYTVDLVTLGKDPFSNQSSNNNSNVNKLNGKKKPPPRPPPPKNKGNNKILEIFGRNKEPPRSRAAVTAIVKPLPPVTGSNVKVDSLIDLHSPSSSPTFTKSSSNVSIQSLGSNEFSQPYKGSTIESGFEDDFGLFLSSNSTTPSQDLLSDIDPFSPISNKSSQGSLSAQIGSPPPFELSNEDPKLKFQPGTIVSLSKPTIIRANVKSKPARPPPPKKGQEVLRGSGLTKAEQITPVKRSSGNVEWSSPPMPTVPPPPPPPEVVQTLLNGPPVPQRPHPQHNAKKDLNRKMPYCKAEYDYDATHPDDLSFKAGDVISLISRVNADWLKGRLNNGTEGIFPENYVNIVIPLEEAEINELNMTVIALFPFTAETWDDLDFQEGEEIKVLRRVNEEWLYGECNGRKGQFPECFVQDITPLLTDS